MPEIPATSGAIISSDSALLNGKKPAVAMVNERLASMSRRPDLFTSRCASHHHDSAALLLP